jgi:hypothetical protein
MFDIPGAEGCFPSAFKFELIESFFLQVLVQRHKYVRPFMSASPRNRRSDHWGERESSRSFPASFTNFGVSVGLGLVLMAMTIAVYWPVNHYPFNSLNDGQYIRDNLQVQQLNWGVVKWSFTTFYAANWHPLTWLSHALDCQLFSLDPGKHHDSNLLLHALSAALLFWILWRATSSVWRSFMVGALFSLHPINVESVAWIAERKNLLSMFFFLVALGAYRWYVRKPQIGHYVVVATVASFALMSKPQAVTLPFVFLLWDYWPLGRMFGTGDSSSEPTQQGDIAPRSLSWLVVEKIPLFALCAVTSFLTVKAQQAGGAMDGALVSYSFPVRLQNAVVSYARYLGKAVWPSHLAFFYPHPRALYRPQVWQASVLLLLITALVIVNQGRRYLAVGWIWFLGTLVPMIGLVQVGGQAMADRYAYLPFVGLFIAICWCVADWAQGSHHSVLWLSGASIAVLLLLASATHRQLSYWSDDVALWSHTVQVTGNNAAAQNVLGEALQREGRWSDAMLHFRAAADTDPLLASPHYHLGIYEQQRGNMPAAIGQFKKVIEATQTDTGLLTSLRADTFFRMYSAYNTLGDHANAEECRDRALNEQHRRLKFEANSLP